MDDQTVEAGRPRSAGRPFPSGHTEDAMLSDDGLRFADLVLAIRRRAGLVVAMTLLCTCGAVVYAVLATPVYRATAIIVPPERRDLDFSQATTALLGGTAGELAQQLGVGGGTAAASRLETLLLSRRLLRKVIEEYDLLPILFPKRWDSAAGAWKALDRGDVPDVWDAEKELEKLYRVKYDVKSGVIRISFDLYDAAIATRILQHYLDQLARIVQADELARISSNMQFIREQLGTTTDPSVLSKLQSLLSTEIENAMMAQNLERVAFTILDPPTASNKKVRPKRAIISALGFAAGIFLGCFAAILRDQTALAAASASSAAPPQGG